jgi:hypothetical protein
MSSEPKIIIEEDVQEHLLEGQPIRVKDYRLAFLLCYGLPLLLSIWIGVRNGGFLFAIFGLGLFLPLGRSVYDVVIHR